MTKLRAESDGNPLTEIDIEEKVAVKATVWPKIEEIQARTVFPAGIPTALANAAMSLSGFNPTVQPIVMYWLTSPLRLLNDVPIGRFSTERSSIYR